MRQEVDWFFGNLGSTTSAFSFADFSGLNLSSDHLALLPASLLSLEARPDGGATVTGWRDAPADAAFAAGAGEPLIARLPGDGGPGPERPLQPVASDGFDGGSLFDDDGIDFDFDQLHAAPAAEEVTAEQGLAEMLLPPGLDMSRAPISQAMLEAFWSGRPDPNATVDDWSDKVDTGLIFQTSSPAVGAAMEFVAFDTSQPTPIMASIEWGG